MGRKRKSLTDGLEQHPAVLAWHRLGLSTSIPREIVVLQRKQNGAVYRISGDDLPGGQVIAKLCSNEKGAIERLVYESVLPQMSSGVIGFFGDVPQDDRSMWLFLEDVGGERYDTNNAQHRMLAADWFARLQSTLSRSDVDDTFPERGAAFYRGFLDSIIAALPDLLSREQNEPEDSRALAEIAAACEQLDTHWDRLAAFCDDVPSVFSHGDCLRKNVHVCATPTGAAIAAFDWGGAGWSPAATDLGQLALPKRGPPDALPDLPTFVEIVRARWTELDVATVLRLAHIGQLFWALKVIGRGLPEFDCDWKSSAAVMADMRIYERALRRSLDAALDLDAAPP